MNTIHRDTMGRVNTGQVYIDTEKCVGCSLCAKYCPNTAIISTMYLPPPHKKGSYVIRPELCDRGSCEDECLAKCKMGAVKVRE